MRSRRTICGGLIISKSIERSSLPLERFMATPAGSRVARKQPFNLDRAHAVEIFRNQALSDHEA